MPLQVYGIDFSGARDAGNKIWIATGTMQANEFCIENCFPAAELPGAVAARDQCLTALRRFIGDLRNCVVGLDFPFGLPGKLVPDDTWTSFVSGFKDHYPSPEEFRSSCIVKTHGKEPRRQTDEGSRTPFSPLNLRIYRQTYFGIGELLSPLVKGGGACVLPMQKRVETLPWLIEVCPASTLKQCGLHRPPYAPYKGTTEENRSARECILDVLEREHTVQTPPRLKARVLDNQGGDALDAVLAAYATLRAVRTRFTLSENCADYLVEGYLFA